MEKKRKILAIGRVCIYYDRVLLLGRFKKVSGDRALGFVIFHENPQSCHE